jgi:hypothetical protein
MPNPRHALLPRRADADGGNAMTPPEEIELRPWYQEGYVWLVIALPFLACVGALITLFLVLHGADVEIPHPE